MGYTGTNKIRGFVSLGCILGCQLLCTPLQSDTQPESFDSYQMRILRNQNQLQEEKIKSLREELHEISQKLYDLKPQLSKRSDPADQSRIVNLSQQLGEKELLLHDLTKEHQELERELAVTKQKLHEKEIEKESLVAMIRKQRDERDQYYDNFKIQMEGLTNAAVKEQKAAVKQIQQHEADIADLHQALAEKNQMLDTVAKSQKIADQQLVDLKKTLASEKATKQELVAYNETLEKKMKDLQVLQNQYAVLKQETDAAATQHVNTIETLLVQMNYADVAHKHLQSQKETLDNRLTFLEEQINATTDLLNSEQAYAGSLAIDYEQLQKNAADLEERLTQREKLLQDRNSLIAQLMLDKEAELERLTAEKESAIQQLVADKETEIRLLKDKHSLVYDSFADHVAGLIADLDAERYHSLHLETILQFPENHPLATELKEKRNELALVNEQLTDLRAHNEWLAQQEENMLQSLSEMEKKYVTEQDQVKNLAARLQTLQEENQTLASDKNDKAVFQTEAQRLLQQNESTLARLKSLAAAQERLIAERNALEQRYSQSLQQLALYEELSGDDEFSDMEDMIADYTVGDDGEEEEDGIPQEDSTQTTLNENEYYDEDGFKHTRIYR